MAAATLLFGIACGLRLTLMTFICVMSAVLAGVAAHGLLGGDTMLASLASMVLALLALQAGYAGGIWLRSRRN